MKVFSKESLSSLASSETIPAANVNSLERVLAKERFSNGGGSGF